MTEVRIEVVLLVERIRAGCGPADIRKALFGSFEQPAQVGLPDSSCLLLRSADWIIVLRTTGGRL